MPRFLVLVIGPRVVHDRVARSLRVAASCPEEAYANARDDLRAAGQDTAGLVFYVRPRAPWRKFRVFPDPKPKSRGGRGGPAGVREPRRPKTGPPSLSISVDEPHGPAS